MSTILYILAGILILGGRTFWALWYLKDADSPESIHQSVLLPYGDEQGFKEHLMRSDGLDVPFIVSLEKTHPVIISAVSMVFRTSVVNERTMKTYCTTIRLVFCIKAPEHQDIVLYRHPKSSWITRRITKLWGTQRNLSLLSPTMNNALGQFIRTHNSVRYRPINTANSLLIPKELQLGLTNQGYNMLLSTEFYMPHASPVHLENKIKDLRALAQQFQTL